MKRLRTVLIGLLVLLDLMILYHSVSAFTACGYDCRILGDSVWFRLTATEGLVLGAALAAVIVVGATACLLEKGR